MQSSRFGRTGLTIPRITLGAGWVGGLIIRADRETRFRQLDEALAAGIDWWDTAALYGQGKSEEMIGEWLRDRPREAWPRLSTKFAVDARAGDVAGQIRRSVEASFVRLGVDRVSLLLLHNQIARGAVSGSIPGVTPEDALRSGGVADVMEGLRAEGLCDHIGFTALGEPSAAAELVGSGRFDAAQVYYNMLNPTAGEPAPPGWSTTDFNRLLDGCARQDMGVMGIRIFAAGYLATTERHGREVPVTDNAEDAAEAARAAAALGALEGEAGDGAQKAVRFGLAEDRLSTIVVGIGEDWHLAHALEALEMGPLPAAALDRLRRLRAADPAFARGSA